MTDILEAARVAVDLWNEAVRWERNRRAATDRPMTFTPVAVPEPNGVLIAHAGTHYGHIARALLEAHQREEALRAERDKMMRSVMETHTSLYGLGDDLLPRVHDVGDAMMEFYCEISALWAERDALRAEVAALRPDPNQDGA